MREIKFRGLTKEGGEWAFGTYCIRHGEHFIVQDYEWDDEVLSETVGQYTGLKAQGREIYEGDIVKCLTGWWPGTVFFKTEGSIDWAVQPLPSYRHNGVYGLNSNDEFEIIGNIHENPGLIQNI